MVKLYCDSCKNEIIDGLVSEFTLVYKDTKSRLLGKKEEVVKGTMMLCSNCAVEIKNIIANKYDNTK